MELTRKQFDILSTLATTKESLTQRQLEEKTGNSLGTINKIMKEFTDNGLVANGEITPEGIDILEPYRAKKAIFIAAGEGAIIEYYPAVTGRSDLSRFPVILTKAAAVEDQSPLEAVAVDGGSILLLRCFVEAQIPECHGVRRADTDGGSLYCGLAVTDESKVLCQIKLLIESYVGFDRDNVAVLRGAMPTARDISTHPSRQRTDGSKFQDLSSHP